MSGEAQTIISRFSGVLLTIRCQGYSDIAAIMETQSVEELIDSLPRKERLIVQRLRMLVLESLPMATEKLSYGVPFYTRNRMICFIWPPSVSWGPPKDKTVEKGVTLGFCQGNKFSNENGRLLKEGRKQVYCLYFKEMSEIDDQEIRSLLFEAELIDEAFRRRKR